MIDFDIFNFDDNITDEQLAAYIDGNATAEETLLIENALNNDTMLSEVLDIAQDGASLGSNFDWELHKGDYGFWELRLPSVVTEEDLEPFKEDEEETESSNLRNDNIMKEELNSKTIGEHGENLYDPVYIRQPDDHSCALRSQQIVLRDFGIDIGFKDLEKLAKEYGVYTDQGTYTYDIGKVLQIAGVNMHQVEGTSFYELTNELAQGHRVIVSVDANELWYNESFSDKLKNWFDDTFKAQGGNHALVVAGVEINPQNPNDVKVVLTDPGVGHLRIEYPLDQFMDAWKDSNCFMAATDNPAPYQYDAETGMEVPSNFFVQQYVNEFVATHGYQLSPDLINIPQDYQPIFTGHLNMVGNMDYASFESSYNAILGNRIPSSLSIKEQIEELAKAQNEEVVAHETKGSIGANGDTEEQNKTPSGKEDNLSGDNENEDDDVVGTSGEVNVGDSDEDSEDDEIKNSEDDDFSEDEE